MISILLSFSFHQLEFIITSNRRLLKLEILDVTKSIYTKFHVQNKHPKNVNNNFHEKDAKTDKLYFPNNI